MSLQFSANLKVHKHRWHILPLTMPLTLLMGNSNLMKLDLHRRSVPHITALSLELRRPTSPEHLQLWWRTNLQCVPQIPSSLAELNHRLLFTEIHS
ncbi:hypothetical protein NL676_035131 [Syzygium grande]|nr:hypothetical protein NL676_035131 [Syzygium grande]